MNNLAEYEVLINKIPGIISSRFVTDKNSEITELHILSNIVRSPKQLVRDVQSAMLTTHNIKLDHRIISVAQIDDEVVFTKDCRFNIHHVKVSSEGAKSQVEVILSKDGDFYTGTAQGGNSTNSRIRLISNATLNAVHSALDIEYTFILADIVSIIISNKKAYVLSISHLFELGEELLCGCCLATKDDNEAVVKATLNAINRRVGKYLK